MFSANCNNPNRLADIFRAHPRHIKKTYEQGRYFDNIIGGTASVGIIESGILDAYLMISDCNEIHINTLRPSALFGISTVGNEMALPTILRCREESKIIFLPKDCFLEMLFENTALLQSYIDYSSQKIQFLLEKIRFHCIQSARNKFITFLLHEMRQDGEVILDCSREDLCLKLGISRANLFREIGHLKSQGLLAIQKNNIKILSSETLVEILNNH
ncbi:MAG: Crp/Fnr family transcriptional regulator [Candidatus Fimivivens sp.]